jgi:two-component system, OmpR family, phosphate regulon sensor histidine kinase PhoR
VTIGLMTTSVVLLVLLEALWLFRSYEKEAFELRRDTSFLLRNAIGELRDSLLLENVQWVSTDSVRTTAHHILSKDSLAAITKIEKSLHADSVHSRSTVRVFISSPSDSLRPDILKPLIRRIGDPVTGNTDRAFILRITEDSLDSVALKKRYAEALERRNLPKPDRIALVRELDREIPHALKKRRNLRPIGSGENHPDLFSPEMKTESVPYGPMFQYYASFSGVRKYLITQLAPELLFSFFVTVLTCGAFVLVYGSLRRQQRLVELKDTFISNITHELKTPVATVGVALEAMKNFSAMDKPQLTREYLDIALKEVNRLVSMTDNILNTSVLEIEKTTLRKDLVDLKSLAQAVISSMNILASGRGSSITLETEGSRFVLFGDSGLLANTLTNLLDNAIKYSDIGARIHVSLRDAGHELVLTVKDDGPGIDPAFHQQIFEKFFRVPKGDVHTVKGYGLGLNYVQSVVRLHDGIISLKSSLEKGSEFIIKFPTPGSR